MHFVDSEGQVHCALAFPSGRQGEVVYPADLCEGDLRALAESFDSVLETLRRTLREGEFPRD